VESAAVVSQPPATSFSWSSDFSVSGRGAGQVGSEVVHRDVSPDYQAVMRGKLLRGRVFTDDDRAVGPPVVIINETLARRFFANEDPLGQRVSFDRVPDARSQWRTIVGVVADERQGGIAAEPRPEFLAPFAQGPRAAMTLLVRTRGAPTSLAPAMRRIVAELDPRLAVASLQTMSDVRAASVGRERFLTTLLLVFAAVGLALAVVGVYGVMAQVARGRAREMGIRLALGAQAAGVQWLVVRHGLLLTAVGVATGLGGSIMATRAMLTLLYGVAPVDPLTFLVVPLLLALAATCASWVPAWRASRADPTVTLRAD
jgi:putative ABC transport system permease protein